MLDFDFTAIEYTLSTVLLGARPLRARLAGLGDLGWARVLAATTHDIYHRPGYVEVDARREGGHPRALIVEQGATALLLPLVIRPIPGGGFDAISPYGYGGPITMGTHDPEFMSDALNEGVELLRSEGIMSLLIRMHPLLNAEPPKGVGTVVLHRGHGGGRPQPIHRSHLEPNASEASP